MTAMSVLARPLSARFDAALALAHRVHRRQARKGTSVPYLAHLLGVAALVLEYEGGETEAIAALLHDTLEDAREYAEPAVEPEQLAGEIAREFGGEVLAIVRHCTDTTDHPKPPWQARKQHYLDSVEHAPRPALLVSAADKLHNVQALVRDYRRHGEQLWQRFNPEAGRAGTLGYYRALADIFRRRLPGALADDLARAVDVLEQAAGARGTWPPPR